MIYYIFGLFYCLKCNEVCLIIFVATYVFDMATCVFFYCLTNNLLINLFLWRDRV